MLHAQCILCFKLICSHSSDQNYVHGKSNIQVELEDLTFVVTESSDYGCQNCFSLVKKRRTLKNKLAEIDESLLLQYRKGAKENGIPCKLKNTSKRLKLPSDQEIHCTTRHLQIYTCTLQQCLYKKWHAYQLPVMYQCLPKPYHSYF